MGERPENRVDRIVRDLMRGHRLKLRGGDAEEKEAIIMAARLAAARQGPQRMSPAFRHRLLRMLESAPRETWVTRRAALVAGLGVVAGAVSGGLLERSLEGSTSGPVAASRVVQPTDGRWFDVGPLDDFTPGQARAVRAGAVGAFVTRSSGGDQVTAVSSICSDLPCELWWDGAQSALICPCHNRSFTAQGASIGTYPLPSLDVVQARVRDGRVQVLGA
jgi:cytochrome b6-f complex iron-sulfur subunit